MPAGSHMPTFSACTHCHSPGSACAVRRQAPRQPDAAGKLCSPMPSSRAVGMTDSVQQKATDEWFWSGWSCNGNSPHKGPEPGLCRLPTFHIAGPQGVLNLDGGQGADGVRLPDLCRAGLRDAHILDLPLAHQLLQHRGRPPESRRSLDKLEILAPTFSSPYVSSRGVFLSTRCCKQKKRRSQATPGGEEASAACRGSGAAVSPVKLGRGTGMVTGWPASSRAGCATGERWA